MRTPAGRRERLGLLLSAGVGVDDLDSSALERLVVRACRGADREGSKPLRAPLASSYCYCWAVPEAVSAIIFPGGAVGLASPRPVPKRSKASPTELFDFPRLSSLAQCAACRIDAPRQTMHQAARLSRGQ